MSAEDERREQVKRFFDRMEQDPRTPAELDAIQAQAWDCPGKHDAAWPCHEEHER